MQVAYNICKIWYLCEIWYWQQLIQSRYELPHQHFKCCIILWPKILREDFLQMRNRD